MPESPEKLPVPEVVKSIETIGINIMAINQRLLVKHACYFERQTSQRMRDIQTPRSDLFDEFGELLQAVYRETELTAEERSSILAVTLMELSQDHLALFGDYDSDIEPMDDETYNYAFIDMKNELLAAAAESQEAFVDKSISLLVNAVDFDWEVLSKIYEGSLQHKLDIFRAKAEPVARSVAKVAIGTILGVLISERLRKN